MTVATAAKQRSDVVVEIGDVPIRLRCDDPVFVRRIMERYSGYISSSEKAAFDFEISWLRRARNPGMKT